MTRAHVCVAASLLLTCPPLMHAQTVTRGTNVTATATIQAIDNTTRTVTLRNEKGEEDTFAVGPAMKRFDELKVGDKVRATYYESMVLQLLKPGDKANPASVEAALNRAKSALPAGILTTQQKQTVTVKAVDPAVPSITVVTEGGRTVTRKVDDPKNIAAVKAGDRIEITYTQALLMNVEPAK